MANDLFKSLSIVAFTIAFVASAVRADDAKSTEPLKLDLPLHTLKGTPEDLPVGPNIEPPPYLGELSRITDGKKEAVDDDAVEFRKGTQWVQVDLGQSFAIHAIAMWHDHRYVQVMHDVILQVSDDPEFKSGVTTLFNNDTDNSSGLGVGTDREYFEMQFGRVVAGKGIKARYVRGYTKGSNQSVLNCWQEIEVYALPAK